MNLSCLFVSLRRFEGLYVFNEQSLVSDTYANIIYNKGFRKYIAKVIKVTIHSNVASRNLPPPRYSRMFCNDQK